jgi:phytoene desaturase
MSNFSRWIPGSPRTVTGKTDDVVIVGAGLAGLSAAMRLAGAGRNVTVIERESIPGGELGELATAALNSIPVQLY